MKLTVALKAWIVEHCSVKADANDDEFRKAAGVALANGTLSVEKLQELSTTQEVKEVSAFETKLDQMMSGFEKLSQVLTDKATATSETKETTTETKATDWHAKLNSQLSSDDSGSDVRVKGAWENYDGTKSALTYPAQRQDGKAHPLAGRPVMDFAEYGRPIESSSELDKAVAGAYAKFVVAAAQRRGSKTFGFQSLPQHDKELLMYAMEKMKWGGSTNGGDWADIQNRNLTPHEQKALIDDATSGGLEAAPIVFDDMVIQAPLLNGELYPLVNVIPLDRGRRVEGVSTGTVTGAWGGIDDTSISLFSTASYVSAFDTTIYRWEGAIKVGLDFLSDTPIDFGSYITAQYGERLLEDLDDVIAAGNGTTQPEGVINKSGTTSVAWGGTTSLGNYESLRFGVGKAEHRGSYGSTAVFCGTETSYQRARALPVGASDARRLGGMDYSSYNWMERPYKINASLSNAQIFYAIMGRYRMYRRRGLTVRTSTEGDTLIRANELLISVTARYGGHLERGACAAVTTTAPS